MHEIWKALFGVLVVGGFILVAGMLTLIAAAEEAHFFPN